MSAGTNMDNQEDQAKSTLQLTSNSIYNYNLTKSCEDIYRSKSSNKQSAISQSDSVEHIRHLDTAISTDNKNNTEVIKSMSTEKHHNKKIRERERKNMLPEKTVFLKWWLDTLGYSKPLRSAWEDEDQSMCQSTQCSHTQYRTYFDGPGVSYHQAADSQAYMPVSNNDTYAHNSVSGVSGPIYIFSQNYKKRKTKTKPLQPSLNSSLSLNQSVNKKLGLYQQLLAKDDNLYDKKCKNASHNQASDCELKTNDSQSWLSIISCTTQHMHDRNTSSNVLPTQVLVVKTPSDNCLNNVDNVDESQQQKVINNNPFSPVDEISNQQQSITDNNMMNEAQCAHNGRNYCHFPVNRRADSQSDDESVSPEVDEGNTMGFTDLQTNKRKTVKLPVQTDQYNLQSYIVTENHQFISDAEFSYSSPLKQEYEELQHKLILNYETDKTQKALYNDQNYNSPAVKTEPDNHNVSHICLQMAKDTCIIPPKASDNTEEIKEAHLPSHSTCKRKTVSPMFYVPLVKYVSAELEKHRRLFGNQKNGSSERNIDIKHRGSYFSQLAEKRSGKKEYQINSHENTTDSTQPHSSKNVNTKDQSANVPSISSSNNQANDKPHSPLTILREVLWESELNNDHLVVHKHMLSDSPGKKQIQTSADDRDISVTPLTGEENGSCKNTTSHIHQDITETDYVTCFLDSAENNYCNMSPDKDQHANSFTNESIRHHNYGKCESDDDNSSLDSQEHISLSSYEYSSVQSVSDDSRNSSVDLDEARSDYLKWSAESWSNTSLPSKSYLKSKVSRIKYAASTTNVEEIRQKQIMQTARLLILMLDKLPIRDPVWNDNYVHANKKRYKKSVCKSSHSDLLQVKTKSTSFHSHMMSLLKKHYSFNKIKSSLKIYKIECASKTNIAANEIKNNSRFGMRMHDRVLLKYKPMSIYKKWRLRRRNTLSFINSLEKRTSQGANYNFRNYVSRTGEQGCFRNKKKHKSNMCHVHMMFPNRKATDGPQKASYEASPSSSVRKMPALSVDLESQRASQNVLFSQLELNKISKENSKRSEINDNKIDVNKSENIICESDIRYNNRRLSRDQAYGISDLNFFKAKPFHRNENMSATKEFNSEASLGPPGLLTCHKPLPHPPKAPLKDSQVKITFLSPPSLNRKVLAYPKSKRHVLRDVQDQKSLAPKIADDLQTTEATQLSIKSLQTESYSGKLSWTKHHGRKQFQTSVIHDTSASASLKSETEKSTEAQTSVNNKKEVLNSKAQKHVLPPLQGFTSENIDISSTGLSMNNSKALKSGTLLDQQRKKAFEQKFCQVKSPCRPNCASPVNCSRVYVKKSQNSFQSHGLILSPLRQRFDNIKLEVNNSLPKVTPSQDLQVPCASHYLCESDGVDYTDMDKKVTNSPVVSVPNAEVNDLQTALVINELDESNSSNSFEIRNFNLFLSKKAIRLEKDIAKVSFQNDIPAAACENGSQVDRDKNVQESSFPYSHSLFGARQWDVNKAINNPVHDRKTCSTAQKNYSETRGKQLNVNIPKNRCQCRSTCKFLTLLLADELEDNEI